MKLFISYCRRDEAVAHLLSYILQLHGITCVIDRQLPVGESYDANLRKWIRSVDGVILLLSKEAVASAWVNQEVGYATARGKKIYPIVLKKKIRPTGLIAATQPYSLFDWSNASELIRRLLVTLGQPAGDSDAAVQLDQVVHGKLPRTKLLVQLFEGLRAGAGKPVVIQHQAAFSIFAAGENTVNPKVAGYNEQYVIQLFKEKETLEELLTSGRANLDLVVWPDRRWGMKAPVRRGWLKARFDNLLGWMEQRQETPGVRFVCDRYDGYNRYIVPGHFCAEGYKLHDTAGYEMTVVKYEPGAVTAAVQQFETAFGLAFKSNEETIEKLRRMCAEQCGTE